MKKSLIIGTGALIILIVGAWLLFGHKQAPTMGGVTTATSSPFGNPDVVGVPAARPDFEGEAAPLDTASQNPATELKLFRAESAPVAGFTLLTRGTSSPQTIIRYAERATGNIFEVTLPTLEKTRLTNETLPQIYEAYFRPDGNAVIYRTLGDNNEIKNMSLALTAPKTSSSTFYTISSTLLQGAMDSLTVGAGDSLSYVLSDAGAVVSSKFNGDAVKTLWKGSFSSWRTTLRKSGVAVFTKPSYALPGYAYSLSNSLTKLLGPLQGLVVKGGSAGDYLLYSYSDGSLMHTAIRAPNGISTEFAPATLADKCIESGKSAGMFFCGVPATNPSGPEPDNWYQGKTHFDDNIWRFDDTTEGASLLLQPSADFGVTLDVSNPQLSTDERYLVFINKTDFSLWVVALR